MFVEYDSIMALEDCEWPDNLIPYARNAHRLLYYPPAITTSIYRSLRDKISKYFGGDGSVTSKEVLLNNSSWFRDEYRFFYNNTSGSSTGDRFRYRIWSDIYDIIECDNHYKLILNEFGVRQNPIVVQLLLADSDELITEMSTTNIVRSHGARQSATVFLVNASKLYRDDHHDFYDTLIKWLVKVQPDVIMSNGGIISSLVWHIKKFGVSDRICGLLSNTYHRVDVDELHFLAGNGNIGNWCDHMRCWDGGATFFTCRFHTYHLMDCLSWVVSDQWGRLISTDYFSLPSPFVNYWNGDFAGVSDEYRKCACGRWYRPFSMYKLRTLTSQSGNRSDELYYGLAAAGVFDCIKTVDVRTGFVRIISSVDISTYKGQLERYFDGLVVDFVVED